jgi:RNA polymerase sigma factor (sigma-70 family)
MPPATDARNGSGRKSVELIRNVPATSGVCAALAAGSMTVIDKTVRMNGTVQSNSEGDRFHPVRYASRVAMTLTLTKMSRQLAPGEPELVSATRAGDDRAFEELYSRYRDRILAFIAGKVHDHGRAEDVAQDVFMSALRRLRASDQPIAFKPWIYEIAKNACIDEFRRGSRSREVPLETDGEFVTDRRPALSFATSASGSRSPVAAIESKQSLDDLRGAFGGLSESHHQLLVMRELEGLTYDEIGDRLDMTRQMVESGLFRARRKLSEEYAELASGRRCEQVQGAIEAGTLQAARALGVRERRRVARHLAHCQPCRHVALMGGVDEALVKPRSIAAKIAAFLPLPLWRRLGGRGRGRGRGTARGSHHLAASVHNAAVGVTDPVAGSFALGPAAAAVAVLALAGGGAGLVQALSTPTHTHRAAVVGPAADREAGSGSGAPVGGASASSFAAHAGAGVASRGGAAGALTASPRRSASRPRRSASAPGPGSAGSSGRASASPPASTASPAASLAGAGAGAASTVRHLGGVAEAKTGLTPVVSGATQGVAKTVKGVAGAVHGTLSNTGKAVGTTVSATGKAVGTTLSATGNALGTVTTTAANTVNQLPSTVNKVAGDAGNVAQGAVAGLGAGPASSATTAASSAATGGNSTAGATVTSPVAKTVKDATQPVQSAVGQLAGALGSK